MNRKMISLTIGALLLALSVPVDAQQTRLYRIGFLSGGSPAPSPTIEAFRDGLRDLGYVEGKNISIEYRFAEGKGDARYPALLADLINAKVELIVADGSGPTRAAKRRLARFRL